VLLCPRARFPGSYAGADLGALYDDAERAMTRCRAVLTTVPADARMPVAALRYLQQTAHDDGSAHGGGGDGGKGGGGSSSPTGHGGALCVLSAEDKYLHYMQLVCGSVAIWGVLPDVCGLLDWRCVWFFFMWFF
jgi:hypothetical protein